MKGKRFFKGRAWWKKGFHSETRNSGKLKKFLFALIFVGIISLSLIASAEILLRFYLSRPYYDMEGVQIVLDREMLYKIRPRSREDINRQGFRGDDFTTAKKGKRRILFLGDSFVFGTNVKEEDSYPRCLERMLGEKYEVLNFGVQGYGPDQSYLQLIEEGLKWKPDAVLLAIYAVNDFADLEKNRLFNLDEQGHLELTEKNVVSPVLPRCYLCYGWNLLRHRFGPEKMVSSDSFYDFSSEDDQEKIFRILFHDIADLDLMTVPDWEKSVFKIRLMAVLLRELDKVLQTRNIPFGIIVIPSIGNIQEDDLFHDIGLSPNRFFFNENTVSNICEEAQIPYLSLYPYFLNNGEKIRFFAPVDAHLTVEGYRYAADLTREFVRDSLLPESKALPSTS